MSRLSKAAIRRQLDQKLKLFEPVRQTVPPTRGWIRAVRDALGMSGEQLARRLGVQKQSVSALEKGEVAGTATINSIRKAAEEMDCVFVYALVPRTSLEATVETRARKYAEKLHKGLQHSMVLEQQGLTADESGRGIQLNTEKFVRETPRDLWEFD